MKSTAKLIKAQNLIREALPEHFSPSFPFYHYEMKKADICESIQSLIKAIKKENRRYG